MSIKLIAVCLAAAALAVAQDDPTLQEQVTKIIRVEGDGRSIVNVLKPGSQVLLDYDDTLGVIVIKGRATLVAKAETAVHELQQVTSSSLKSRDIELTIHVLGGSSTGSAAEPEAPGLAGVYKQLYRTFPFKSYQLLTTMLMRSGQGTFSSTQGLMKSPDATPELIMPGSYNLRCESVSVSAGDPPIIHVRKFHFTAQIPHATGKNGAEWQQSEIGIQTDVDLREGQKVVVGTSNVEPAGTTLFIVVSARLL
jgi:hypothetical protein